MTTELVAVDDAATRDAARDLIAEYLRWIASVAAASYGLSFDIDAMVTSDIEDRAKFHPPSGRFYVVRHEDANVGMTKYQPLDTMDRYRSNALFMELRF